MSLSVERILECEAALHALEPFRNAEELTADERTAWDVLTEALLAIARGENLDWQPGEPMKMRRVRRLRVEYFHPLTPRREVEDAPTTPTT